MKLITNKEGPQIYEIIPKGLGSFLGGQSVMNIIPLEVDG